MLIGAHTPAAHPLAEAEARSADLVQIFLSNPQGWRKPEPRNDAAELLASSLPIYVHAPNPCRTGSPARNASPSPGSSAGALPSSVGAIAVSAPAITSVA